MGKAFFVEKTSVNYKHCLTICYMFQLGLLINTYFNYCNSSNDLL